jgi:hypothetical protein
MPPRPRFSWPLRIFLFIIVFNMVFRSLSVLAPWGEWLGELKMDRLPRRLPTLDEIDELAAEASAENPHPVREDVLRSCDAVWEYWRPWPGRETRARLHEPEDWGKFAFCWLSSRFEFLENVVGINQEWPMFSPNVSKQKWLARSRLTFADGSQRIVRLAADPEDLTNFSHWFQEKILDYEMYVREGDGRFNDCLGYCNLLSHRYPRNEQGAELVRINLFLVNYKFPPPDVDAAEFLRQQTGPPPHQIRGDFFEYDVASRKGRKVTTPLSSHP